MDINPRLPTVGSRDYDRQLNARLYELFRQISVQLNALTDGKMRVVTTTEKNALTPTEGMIVFDTTLNKMCQYSGSGWETITSV